MASLRKRDEERERKWGLLLANSNDVLRDPFHARLVSSPPFASPLLFLVRLRVRLPLLPPPQTCHVIPLSKQASLLFPLSHVQIFFYVFQVLTRAFISDALSRKKKCIIQIELDWHGIFVPRDVKGKLLFPISVGPLFFFPVQIPTAVM